jgi:hypothetical protein
VAAVTLETILAAFVACSALFLVGCLGGWLLFKAQGRLWALPAVFVGAFVVAVGFTYIVTLIVPAT